ncbi:MAG: hypothetical protein V3U56_04740 [Syntrophobacteria bacterium]
MSTYKPGYFMNNLLRPRNWEPACGTERSAASANNMAVLPGVLGCSFGRLRTGSPCDVPFRYASDQSRGAAGRLPGGPTIFVVSRQQFMKYPG